MGTKRLLFILISLPLIALGQETNRFAGTLRVGEYIGEADYQYKIIDSDTVLDGSFQMRRSNLQALLEKEDSSFLFAGTFKDDYPVGYWRFQFGEFQSESETQVVDFQYRVKVSGIQEEANGRIKNGKPHGPWTYSVSQVKDSEFEKNLFYSNIDFDSGIPQRNFRIENDSSTLVGRFLRNGLAHDKWSLFAIAELGEAESWIFNDGILRTVMQKENGVETATQVFGEIPDSTKTINLDSRYIKVLKLQQSHKNSASVFDGKMPGMLEENARYYKKIDTILSELGESSFLPEFKVRVPFYPLDSVEMVQLDSIKMRFEKSKEIADFFLNDTQLNILRLSDADAQYLYSVVSEISERFLVPIEKAVEYHKEEILELASRKKLFENLWPAGFPSKEISLAIQVDSITTSKTFKLPDAGKFFFEGNTISSLEQISQYAQNCLQSIEWVLGAKLTQEKRQQELIALEEQLIAENKKLQQLIDSTKNSIDPIYKRALDRIKSVSDKDLSDFSTQEEINSARLLVTCYEQMNALAKAVVGLPEQSEEIAAIYNDRVWNPFMATLMDEEVKRRITNAYRRMLVPYFLQKIQADLSCENSGELAFLMENTFQRMLLLRNEETSKIERKLRKEQDPEVIMQLLKVLPTTNEN